MKVDRKKEAAKRLLRAERLMYRASELMRQAKTDLSVVIGLGKVYKTIQDALVCSKLAQFTLEKIREASTAEIDETSAAYLAKQIREKEAANESLGKYVITLTSVGNPDFGQYAPKSPPMTVG